MTTCDNLWQLWQLRYADEQQSLDHAEDDEHEPEHDVRIVKREPWTTDKGFTTLIS